MKKYIYLMVCLLILSHNVYADNYVTLSGPAISNLNDLSDVNAGTPTDNQSLTWDNATSKWVPETITGGSGGVAGTPGGDEGDIQFNTDATFDGEDNFQWDATNNLCTIDGTINKAALRITTTTDDYPLFDFVPYAHDSIYLTFDSYLSGGWLSSDLGSNFAIGKNADSLKILGDSAIAQGGAITWNTLCYWNINGNMYFPADHRFIYLGANTTDFSLSSDGNNGVLTSTGRIDIDTTVSANSAILGTTYIDSGLGVEGDITGNVATLTEVIATTLTENGNAVYNSTETPGGVLGGTWASPTLDSNVGSFAKSFVITNATATADGSLWRVPAACTITAVHLLCKGGTVVGHLTEQDANGLNDVGVDAATDITGVTNTNVNDDGGLSNPSIDSADYIGWRTTSITGTNTYTIVSFEGTWD